MMKNLCLDISLSNKCEGRDCAYCMCQGFHDGSIMDRNTAVDFTRHFLSYSRARRLTTKIDLIGNGEPLFNPDLPAIASDLRDLAPNCTMFLVSSGCQTDEEEEMLLEVAQVSYRYFDEEEIARNGPSFILYMKYDVEEKAHERFARTLELPFLAITAPVNFSLGMSTEEIVSRYNRAIRLLADTGFVLVHKTPLTRYGVEAESWWLNKDRRMVNLKLNPLYGVGGAYGKAGAHLPDRIQFWGDTGYLLLQSDNTVACCPNSVAGYISADQEIEQITEQALAIYHGYHNTDSSTRDCQHCPVRLAQV